MPLAILPLDGQGWPAQGEWTYEDYLRLPDDGRRYEVIRGRLYLAPLLNFAHQASLSRLMAEVATFVEKQGLGVVLPTPFDVILPEGIATPIEPDLLFICQKNLPQRGAKNFQGVPDWVAEILSPSSHVYDCTIKLAAYQDAGVPELWLVDTYSFEIVSYGLSEDGRGYVELERGGVGAEIGSIALPGFRLKVEELFH